MATITWPGESVGGHCGGPAVCSLLKLEDVPDLNYYAVIELRFHRSYQSPFFRRTGKVRFSLKARRSHQATTRMRRKLPSYSILRASCTLETWAISFLPVQ